MILTTQGLTKRYGKITAVNQLDLSIPRNAVFGILGPNGSGKTTTLGLVLDVIERSSGSYAWQIGQPGKERKKIGSILESPNFYPYLSGKENLKVAAGIKGTSDENIDKVIQQVGLEERSSDKFKTYSLGMKQRLAIASALLADPEVLILDEPTNGLDPKGIVEIRELILEIAAEGRTIILASHLLDEVQRVCSHFCVLQKGSLIYSGSVSELNEQTHRFRISAPDLKTLDKGLRQTPEVMIEETEENSLTIKLADDFSPAQLTERMAEKGVFLNLLAPVSHSLEQKFIEILDQHA